MRKDIELLKQISDFRYKSGKAHLFHSINKIVARFGTIIKTERIYINKNYLDYLSEKMFGDRNRIRSFFVGNNEYVRLNIVEEFLKDYNRDIVTEIKEDFLELKKFNSEYSANLRKRLKEILEENSEISFEDFDLMEKYFKNWKRLEERIKYFIPEEFYERKNTYFYNSLLSYTRFFKRMDLIYQKAIAYINEN